MKKILYLILLICPVLLYNCGPDNPLKPNTPQAGTLPPITTEGLQTFGYKINGKVVRYKSQSARYINLDHIPETGQLALRLNNRSFDAGFRLDSVLNAGIFKLDPNKVVDLNYVHGASFTDNINDKKYWILIEGGGEILRYHIDNNKPEYIISGTFWYTVIDEDNPTDTAYITDGRFDLYKR